MVDQLENNWSGIGFRGGGWLASFTERSRPQEAASSRAVGQPEKPSMGTLVWWCWWPPPPPSPPPPWESQSQSAQRARPSAAQRAAAGCDPQLSQIGDRTCFWDSAFAACTWRSHATQSRAASARQKSVAAASPQYSHPTPRRSPTPPFSSAIPVSRTKPSPHESFSTKRRRRIRRRTLPSKPETFSSGKREGKAEAHHLWMTAPLNPDPRPEEPTQKRHMWRTREAEEEPGAKAVPPQTSNTTPQRHPPRHFVPTRHGKSKYEAHTSFTVATTTSILPVRLLAQSWWGQVLAVLVVAPYQRRSHSGVRLKRR